MCYLCPVVSFCKGTFTGKTRLELNKYKQLNSINMNKNFISAQSYVTPEIEVTEIVSEGVLCNSGTPAAPDFGYDPDFN